MFKSLALTQPKRRSIAWDDIEALPIHAAVFGAIAFVMVAMTNLAPGLASTTLKTVGVVACIALRHAWLTLHDENMEGA